MIKRIIQSLVICWVFSAALGLLFATTMSGTFRPSVALLPGVVPVALFVSSLVAVVLTPFVALGMRRGLRRVLGGGLALWLCLATYTVFVIPKFGAPAMNMLLPLAVAGVLILAVVLGSGSAGGNSNATDGQERAATADSDGSVTNRR